MTDIRELYQNCLTAFIDQRYEDCVELGLFLKDHVYNVDLYHVILNSLDRLGKSHSKAPLAVEFKTILQQLPYEYSLLLLSEGEAQIASVAPEAADEVQYCRAHYYAGSRLVTLGKYPEAARLLEACLMHAGNAQAQFVERPLARAELETIEPHLKDGSVSLDLRRCTDAFRNQDYSQCARVGLSILGKVVSPDLAHMLLISLHRLGMMENRDEVGAMFVKLFSFDPWNVALLKLTLGQSTLEEVLPSAQNEEQRCQAYYYAGARLSTTGQISKASACFEKCLTFRTECLERELAEAEVRS